MNSVTLNFWLNKVCIKLKFQFDVHGCKLVGKISQYIRKRYFFTVVSITDAAIHGLVDVVMRLQCIFVPVNYLILFHLFV